MTTPKISDIDPCISEWFEEWERNRDFVAGERVIKSKAKAKTYLPPEAGLDDAQHANFVKRTRFYPGAARTHEGLLGLLFRKASKVTKPAGETYERMLETITADYLTIDDLAEDVASEYLITNRVGLLVDLPATAGVMSVAEAQKSGARPFISTYLAESILGIETGLINGFKAITRVRLQEDALTIRELRFEGGVYTVTMHRKATDGAEYIAEPTITPLRKGKPIDAGIPFTLVTSDRRYKPSKPRLSDVCALNAQHYLECSNLAVFTYWQGHPTPFMFGPAKVASLSFTPGSAIIGEVKSGNDVKIGFLKVGSDGFDPIDKQIAATASDMAKVGARVLADEKAGVEAAETLAIKTASENAVLANSARLISRKISDALKWVSYWLDLPEDAISYACNVDYGASKLTDAEIASRMALYQADIISKDTFLDMLIDGDVLPENFDRDEDEKRINEAVRARPTDETAPYDDDEPEDVPEQEAEPVSAE